MYTIIHVHDVLIFTDYVTDLSDFFIHVPYSYHSALFVPKNKLRVTYPKTTLL
jgi:hypothetical protein